MDKGFRALASFAFLFSSPRRRIVALAVVANLLAYGLIAVSLETSYRQHSERAAIATYNTNRLVAQSIAETFDRIDLGIKAIGDEFIFQRRRKAYNPQELTEFLTHMHAQIPMTDGLYVVDADGLLAASSGIMPSGVSFVDRDYFKQLRDNPETGLLISPPLLGRVSKKWVVVLARRLDAGDGKFLGIALAAVQIDWFSRKFAELEVGQHGAVVLRGDASRDFDLLARFPEAGFVGQTKVSDTFRATITANPQQGTYQAVAGADSIRRTFSYQAVRGYPLITLVGLAPQDFLVSWWNELYKMMSLAAIFTLFSAIGGFALLKTWKDLEQKSVELARSNADLEQFAFIASHDLQTPLRNIVSFSQLLERRYGDKLDADAREFINYIVDGAKRMSMMVIDLLEYARITDKKRRLETIDLSLAVRTAILDLGTMFESTGASIRVGDLPLVQAERQRVESLFFNLVDNALKYRRPEAKTQIEISAQPDGTGFWRISVSDNGIGIGKDYLEKIFVIFQRLEPKKYPEGTGVGLAICRRIVERYGGRIWVESEPGQGTRFHFTLPAAPVDVPTPEVSALASKIAQP